MKGELITKAVLISMGYKIIHFNNDSSCHQCLMKTRKLEGCYHTTCIKEEFIIADKNDNVEPLKAFIGMLKNVEATHA